jgi:DNA-directed RNA polymerase specialized sigma24 family protein
LCSGASSFDEFLDLLCAKYAKASVADADDAKWHVGKVETGLAHWAENSLPHKGRLIANRLASLFHALPLLERTSLALVALEGFSLAQAAIVTASHADTCRQALWSARRKLEQIA